MSEDNSDADGRDPERPWVRKTTPKPVRIRVTPKVSAPEPEPEPEPENPEDKAEGEDTPAEAVEVDTGQEQDPGQMQQAYQKVIAALNGVAETGKVILIIGYRDSGKTFFVEQAKAMANDFFDAGGTLKLVADQIRSESGLRSTKEPERTIFSRKNRDDPGCRSETFTLLDIPGETFGDLIGFSRSGEDDPKRNVAKLLDLVQPNPQAGSSAEQSVTDWKELHQLMATVALADGLILVLNGPAAMQCRDLRAPEKVGAAAGPMADQDWKEAKSSVERSLGLLFTLSSFLRVVEEMRWDDPNKRVGEANFSKLQAWDRILQLTRAEFERKLVRSNVKCPVPLMVTMTKADQIFGFGASEVAELDARNGQGPFPIMIESKDPWLSLLRADELVNLKPYNEIAGNFETVNLDFSSASPGGAQLSADEQESLIRDGFLRHGRGIKEALYWVLDKIAERDERAAAEEQPSSKLKYWFGSWLGRWFLGRDPIYQSALERRLDLDGDFRKLAKSK